MKLINKRSIAVTHTLEDGTPTHSFSTLMDDLSTIVRNTCRAPLSGDDSPSFHVTTEANPKQRRAIELIKQITVQPVLQSVRRTPGSR